MVKGIALLHQSVVNHPGGVENAQGERKQVAEGRDGIGKGPRPRGALVRVHEAVEGLEDDVERDERKGGPLDDDLFALPGKQPDQGLGLGEPQERVGDDADDLELVAAQDILLQGLGVLDPIGILRLGGPKGGGRRNGQRDGDAERRHLLQPRPPSDAGAGAGIGEALAAEDDHAPVDKGPRRDEEHDDQRICDDGRRGEGVALRKRRRVKGVVKVGILGRVAARDVGGGRLLDGASAAIRNERRQDGRADGLKGPGRAERDDLAIWEVDGAPSRQVDDGTRAPGATGNQRLGGRGGRHGCWRRLRQAFGLES